MIDLRIYAPQIKELVSCRRFLEYNGIKVNRRGFAVCPLHGDTDASLKVYDGDRGWTCYGCHKGGDVINLAKAYYGVTFSETIRRLNDDFSLGLTLDKAPSVRDRFVFAARRAVEVENRRREERRAELEEKEYLDWLGWLIWLDAMATDNEPKRDEEWSPAFCGWIQLRANVLGRLKEIEERRIKTDGGQHTERTDDQNDTSAVRR